MEQFGSSFGTVLEQFFMEIYRILQDSTGFYRKEQCWSNERFSINSLAFCRILQDYIELEQFWSSFGTIFGEDVQHRFREGEMMAARRAWASRGQARQGLGS